ncbi:2-Hydroxyacid oxidase 1-like [Uloborus diversus]|uniref:2-Hydroxyacid oxidase 1-like n=1 Tax=Uloborus diversus TaxID=327109 RepID=UPI00240985F0|nr:2-Hydroxyacid oxidase 1-like [Uloborus diversus]
MLSWALASLLLVSATTIRASPTPDGSVGIGVGASFETSADLSADIGFDETIEAQISGSDDSSVYQGPIEWDDDCDCRLDDNDYYDDILYIARRYQDFLSVRDFQTFTEKEVDSVREHTYNHGSDNETTYFENERAFQRLRLRPRVLRGVGTRDTTTQLLGDDSSFPLGLISNAFMEFADPDGEIGIARAAECEGVPYIVSAFSSTDLEEISLRAPHANLWMETFIFFDRSITQSIVERAEAAGYRAIVISVDRPVHPNLILTAKDHLVLPEYIRLPNIENDLSNEGFEHLDAVEENFIDADFGGNNRNYFRRHHVLSNIELVKGRGYFKTTKVDQKYERYERCIGSFLVSEIYNYLINPAQSWEDLRWITTLTDLPIVVRGILTGCDAVRAVENGVSAIIVDNSGGQTVDTAPASIEALAEVLEAVDVYQNIEVYLAGGVRWGTDIFKALAMGADAVFINKPVTWGLFHSGKCGVRRVIQLLRAEFDRDMAFMGTKHVDEITSTMLVSENYFHNRYRPDDVDARNTVREDQLECPFGYDYDEGYQQDLTDVNDLNLVKRNGKFRTYL